MLQWPHAAHGTVPKRKTHALQAFMQLLRLEGHMQDCGVTPEGSRRGRK